MLDADGTLTTPPEPVGAETPVPGEAAVDAPALDADTLVSDEHTPMPVANAFASDSALDENEPGSAETSLEQSGDGSQAESETSPPDKSPDESLLPDIPPAPDDLEILRLREMLFARELALLERINLFYENPMVTTRKVSEVLAEAIHLRSAKDPHLHMAMEPLVDAIVKESFHSRRNDFVGALSPLMGPTIRKSIAESFRSMMGSFSKSVEMAFSWKGLRWRFEAWRSGKPFSEIVMLNTLVYRVEQLFFIHNGTGLVLSHLAGDSVESQDADMVSAMLTAIQDFVRDCFTGGKDEDLHSLQLGEFTIVIESGMYAYLACVVRGTPPADFHGQLRAALELMHVEFNDHLESFNGDSEPFTGAVRYLDSCMVSHFVGDDKKLSLFAKLLPVAILLVLLAGAGYWYHTARQAAAERAAAVARHDAFLASMRTAVGYLRNEPGLMVSNVVETPEPPWEIHVLKDALSRSPEEVLRENGVNPSLFLPKIIPFMSYEPSIVVRRVRQAIQPPETVRVVFDEQGRLTFTGTAPMSWIVSTREDARAIPGVESVDVSGVRDPMMDQINAMIAEVENTVIEFPLGRDTPTTADMPKLKKAIDTLVELENITKQMGFSATLTIYGHADSVGDVKRNYELSQARARTVAGLLYAKGSSMPVTIYGMGSEYPKGSERESQASRRIELRVHFALSPSASPEMFRR